MDKPEENRTEFFIGELEDMHNTYENRIQSLTRRVTALEEKNRGQYDDDPMKAMAPLIIMFVVIQLLPLIGDLVIKWRSSSLES